MNTLEYQARNDWLPVEVIVTLPPDLRQIAWTAGIVSGRFSTNQIREAEGLLPYASEDA